MQRLLHEGMDAGLCGFSIQRLGRNSTQADFDGTPMVTDTMCDEDILAWPRCSPSATRASSRSPRRPARSRQDLAVRREARRGVRAARDPQRHRPHPPQPRPAPQVARLAAAAAGTQGLQVYGQCATVRSGFVFTPRELEPLRLLEAVAGADHRHPRREAGQDGRPGAARGHGRRRDPQQGRATASCAPASAARSRTSSCRASPADPELEQYVGPLARATSPRRRASTPAR